MLSQLSSIHIILCCRLEPVRMDALLGLWYLRVRQCQHERAALIPLFDAAQVCITVAPWAEEPRRLSAFEASPKVSSRSFNRQGWRLQGSTTRHQYGILLPTPAAPSRSPYGTRLSQPSVPYMYR